MVGGAQDRGELGRAFRDAPMDLAYPEDGMVRIAPPRIRRMWPGW